MATRPNLRVNSDSFMPCATPPINSRTLPFPSPLSPEAFDCPLHSHLDLTDHNTLAHRNTSAAEPTAEHADDLQTSLISVFSDPTVQRDFVLPNSLQSHSPLQPIHHIHQQAPMHQPVSSNSLQPPSLPISSTSSFPPHPHFSPKNPAQPTTTSSISLPPLPPTFSQPIPCDHHKRKHHETYTLPEPWNDMDTIHGMDMDTIHGMEMVTGPVPARVVEYMYNQADSRAKKSANDKKLVLRKRLKESNHSETGSRSAISSRREAKVSRMYRQEYLHSTQDELRQSAKDKALLLAYLKCLRKFIDDNKLTLDERRTDNTLDAVID